MSRLRVAGCSRPGAQDTARELARPRRADGVGERAPQSVQNGSHSGVGCERAVLLSPVGGVWSLTRCWDLTACSWRRARPRSLRPHGSGRLLLLPLLLRGWTCAPAEACGGRRPGLFSQARARPPTTPTRCAYCSRR